MDRYLFDVGTPQKVPVIEEELHASNTRQIKERSVLKRLWLGVLVVLLAGCAEARAPIGVPPVGFVEGHVTIGPLRPGPERIDQTPEPIPPEVFAQYVIRVYRSDGSTKVLDMKIEADGTYRIGLGAGTYWIATVRSDGGRMFGGAPQSIEIQSGQTLQLDIDIDTGMR